MLRLLAAGILTLSSCLTSAAAADESAHNPPTVISERGKLLVDEDLSRPIEGKTSGSIKNLTSGWRLKPGKWECVDGVLQGTQIKEENHSAVASRAFAFKDAIIQVDCQLHGGRQVIVRVNDTGEHICRVIVRKDGFAAQRDDHDHEGPDVAVPFGRIDLPIGPEDWKTVLLEIKGDQLAASIDGKTVTGSNLLLGQPKANIGLVATGASPRFRNLKIWEALPKSAAAGKRESRRNGTTDYR